MPRKKSKVSFKSTTRTRAPSTNNPNEQFSSNIQNEMHTTARSNHKKLLEEMSDKINLPKDVNQTSSGNILNIITPCIADEDNSLLIGMSNENGIKNAIFNMSPDSAAGPDGFNELDSEIITKMLQNRDNNNLKLRARMNRILSNLNKMNVRTNHCLREANQVANSLAKHAFSHEIWRHFATYQELPRETKGSYQLDKHQLPSLRIRYDKAKFFVS
ncbi:hypothetical protein P3S67_023867 [Capsicum chacoense]